MPRCRVLLLEKFGVLSRGIADHLDEIGCSVIGPHMSVESAREVTRLTRPDIAVMDVRLMRENTLAFGGELAAKGIPVVFLAAAPADRAACHQAGLDCIDRPSHPKLLVRHMLRRLQRHRVAA